jgi:hypothetical protein
MPAAAEDEPTAPGQPQHAPVPDPDDRPGAADATARPARRAVEAERTPPVDGPVRVAGAEPVLDRDSVLAAYDDARRGGVGGAGEGRRQEDGGERQPDKALKELDQQELPPPDSVPEFTSH